MTSPSSIQWLKVIELLIWMKILSLLVWVTDLHWLPFLLSIITSIPSWVRSLVPETKTVTLWAILIYSRNGLLISRTLYFSKATHVNDVSASLIYNIFTNTNSSFISGVLISDTSDHFPVFFSTSINQSETDKRILQYTICNRKYWSIYYHHSWFRFEIYLLNWGC